MELIQVWRLSDAPEELRRLAGDVHPDPQDWLAVVPQKAKQSPRLPWMYSEFVGFDWCEVTYIPHPTREDAQVAIGRH